MFRIKRKAVLISHDIASGEATGESSKKARETLGGVAGRTNADVADVGCQPASFGLKLNGGVVTSVVQDMPPETNATVHGVDSKVIQEFEKVDLGPRCVTICDHLGIQHYHDLKWVSMQMVSEYKPVEREKFRALLGSYERCKESGVLAGVDGEGCAEVLKAPKKGSQLAVSGGAGVQSGGNAAALQPAMKTHVARSYKKCNDCGSDGYSMTLGDAVQFLSGKRTKNHRETYKEFFSHIATSPLTADQINTLPYDDVRNAVKKETAAFILRMCKEDVIALRKQGHEVTCLFECRKCNQNGTPRYMCDRVRKGKDGEYFSQRENGFTTEICVRFQFWELLRKFNTRAGLKHTPS